MRKNMLGRRQVVCELAIAGRLPFFLVSNVRAALRLRRNYVLTGTRWRLSKESEEAFPRRSECLHLGMLRAMRRLSSRLHHRHQEAMDSGLVIRESVHCNLNSLTVSVDDQKKTCAAGGCLASAFDY